MILVFVAGHGKITVNGEAHEIAPLTTMFVPAAMNELVIEGNIIYLKCCLPDEKYQKILHKGAVYTDISDLLL